MDGGLAMAIRVECACGKVSTAPDSAAGKTGRCKACGAAIAIPDVGPSSDLAIALDPDDDPRAAPFAPKLTASPAGQRAEVPAARGGFWSGPVISRAFLYLIAFLSGLWILGIPMRAGNGMSNPATEGSALICFTVAVAGLACSSPRRPT